MHKRPNHAPPLLIVTALALSLTGCATLMNAFGPSNSEEQFFIGTVQVSDPSTGTPFGPPYETVAHRSLYPSEGLIVEKVWHDGKMSRTALRQQKGQAVFEAHDAERSFSGTVTMKKNDWSFSGWDYALFMSNGTGSIRGEAITTGEDFKTHKIFSNLDGVALAAIEETFTRCDKDAYKKALIRLREQARADGRR